MAIGEEGFNGHSCGGKKNPLVQVCLAGHDSTCLPPDIRVIGASTGTGGAGETRTHNQRIRSPVLYPLSYRGSSWKRNREVVTQKNWRCQIISFNYSTASKNTPKVVSQLTDYPL